MDKYDNTRIESDIVDGTVMAMGNQKAIGQIINIGNDEEVSVLESAKIIHKIVSSGNKLKIKYIDYKEIFGLYKDIQKRKPNLDKAKKLLGYSPNVSFKQGLKKTIAAIKELK